MRTHRLLFGIAFAAALIAAHAATSNAQTRVPGSAGNSWVDTGITVHRGTLVQISATGEVDFGPPGTFGPEGEPRPGGTLGFPSDVPYRYGLVARLTSSMTNPDDELREDFAYGDRTTYCSPFTARLWLTANDDEPADNSGEYLATITLATCDPGDNTVRRTRVHVTDEQGADVEGAEVYVNGEMMGLTGRDGNVDFPRLAAGTRIVARKRVFESRTYRENHRAGSTQNWNYRVYVTSLVVNADGSLADFGVADPAATQELRVSRSNTVIGLHLVASVEWDAWAAELEAIRDNNIRAASQWLYNATDGQMLIEQVELVDNAALWEDADFRIHTNWSLRPNVARGGAFFDRCLTCANDWMNLSRTNWSYYYAHEFGHYGMDLRDEYADDSPISCTGNIPMTSGPFAWNDMNRDPRASCIMWNTAPKLCSSHADNPHALGTRQGAEDCWSHVIGRYRDAEGSRWLLRSPAARGTIVGMLPAMPVAGWATRVAIDNRSEPDLCLPVEMRVTRRDDGRPLSEVEVFSHTASGRRLLQGKSRIDDPSTPEDETGLITVTGIHIGDRVTTGRGGSFTFTSCSSAGRAPGAPGDSARRVGPIRLETLSVGPDPFEVAATVDFEAGAARLRVRVDGAELKVAPRVRFAPSGEKDRKVRTRFDASLKEYVGSLERLAPGTPATYEITAVDATGREVVRRGAMVLTRLEAQEQAEAFSADGVLSLTVPVDALQSSAMLAIGPSHAPVPALEEGQVLVAGPVALSAQAADKLSSPGVVRFQLPDHQGKRGSLAYNGADHYDAKSFAILRFNSETGGWESIGGTLLADAAIVTARIDRLGTYALVARPLQGVKPQAR